MYIGNKGIITAKTILIKKKKKKKKVREISLPYFKTYYMAPAIETVGHW